MVTLHDGYESAKTKTKILVVEDIRATRLLLKHFLNNAGYESYTASNGREGWLRIVAGELPHAIVTDIEMPVWNGCQLINQVRRSPVHRIRKIPVIVCSSSQDRGMIANVIASGADRFLAKPIDLQVLLAKLEELLADPDPASGSR